MGSRRRFGLKNPATIGWSPTNTITACRILDFTAPAGDVEWVMSSAITKRGAHGEVVEMEDARRFMLAPLNGGIRSLIRWP